MQVLDTLRSKVFTFPGAPQGLLLLLLIFHLLGNGWWLWQDNHPVRTDEETHMLLARDYHRALFPTTGNTGFTARLAAAARVETGAHNPVHPPLLHIAGAVWTRLVGYSVDRLAFTNTLAFLAAIVGVYLLARHFLDPWSALFGTTVFSFMPVVFTASRFFMTDYFSMTLVVWALLALIKSDLFRNSRWSLVFGLLNGLGILARSTTFLYYLVPAILAFSLGFLVLLRRDKEVPFDQAAFVKLVLNASLVVMVSAAVFSPWYGLHGKRFMAYWMQQHRAGSGGPLAVARFVDGETSPIDVAPASDDHDVEKDEHPVAGAAKAAAPKAHVEVRRFQFRLSRDIPWRRYAVFLINNGVFLPTFLLGGVGMVAALALARFRRNITVWYLLLSFWGGYVLLTLLVSFATPRYLLPTIPAFALFSTLAILAIPWPGIRRAAQGGFLVLLLFQYGNLTFHPYGRFGKASIPIVVDRIAQESYDDDGLNLYKDSLVLGFSYSRLSSPVRHNYKDRMFFAMLRNEQKYPYCGMEANYARLNIRGMMLDERHFWPDTEHANPFKRHDIPPELEPYRFLRHYGWSKEIEDIVPLLSIVDYVAYTTEGIDEETETHWLSVLGQHGYEVIERFHEERFGRVPERFFAVLARKPLVAIPTITTPEDMKNLNVFELDNFRHSQAYSKASPDLRLLLDAQLKAGFEARGKPQPMTDDVSFISASLDHYRDDIFVFHLVFKASEEQPPRRRLLFQGIVAPEDMMRHFSDTSGRPGLFNFAFAPTPSMNLWPTNDYVAVRFPLNVASIPYNMQFCFHSSKDGIVSEVMDLGVVNFANVPRENNNGT